MILHIVTHYNSAARMVMERTEHTMLVGEGAQKFLLKNQVPLIPTRDLLCDRELRMFNTSVKVEGLLIFFLKFPILEFYEQIKNKSDFTMQTPFKETPKGTVGMQQNKRNLWKEE